VRSNRACGANFYNIFTPALCSMAAHCKESNDMDLWFVGLTVALALLTWAGIVLCARLRLRP